MTARARGRTAPCRRRGLPLTRIVPKRLIMLTGATPRAESPRFAVEGHSPDVRV
jgi:hypothetical protein